MKKLLASAAVVALMAAASGSAFAAGEASTSWDLSLTAPKVCIIPGAGSNVAFPLTGVVSADGTVAATNTVLATFTDAYCTYDAKVKATTTNGALTLDGDLVSQLVAAPAGFSNIIAYAGKADWGTLGLTATVQADGTTAGGSNETVGSSGPRKNNLVVSVATLANSTPRVSGDYSDTLTVELIPTP